MTSHVENPDTQLSVEHLSCEAIAALADGELSRRQALQDVGDVHGAHEDGLGLAGVVGQ